MSEAVQTLTEYLSFLDFTQAVSIRTIAEHPQPMYQEEVIKLASLVAEIEEAKKFPKSLLEQLTDITEE